MPKAKQVKFYAVRCGRVPGVYETWAEAERQTLHFPGALHKAFPNRMAALGWANPLGSTQQRETGITENLLFSAAPDDRPNKQPPKSLDTSFVPYKTIIKPEFHLDQPENKSTDPILTTQQMQILDKILRGENFFFTGSAGTGKSVLLRAIIKAFQERAAEPIQASERDVGAYLRGDAGWRIGWKGVDRWKLEVTASTGMAAINIGGCTLHSWAGIGLGQLPAEVLSNNIRKNNITRDRWRTTGALIVDEISMIDGKLLDKLDLIAKKIRESERPFGGIQVIFCGDFFQLPPVARSDGPPAAFAFESNAWSKLFPDGNMMGLTRVFRQKDDTFVKVLEGMRKGRTSTDAMCVLQGCDRIVKYDDGIEPVSLYPSKREVDAVNRRRLCALETPIVVYTARDIPGVNSKGYAISESDATSVLDKNTIWPAEIGLKVGAMVMLVTNMQDGALVNGSTGIIVDFCDVNTASSKGIYLPQRAMGFNPSPQTLWPVVEFVPSKHAGSQIPKRTLIPQMAVDVINAMGGQEAARHQIPLILAWALTIHKSQGQTLERVRVDLNNIFVEGQTYVAISRAVSLDTLEIRNFTPHKVIAHPKVIKWAEPLEEQQRTDEEWDEIMGEVAFDV